MESENREQECRTLSQRKRQAILAAAKLEFDAAGFEATSMDQIAARAQVSKRTVYNHFASKDLLFTAIRSELFCRLASIECHYDPAVPLAEQLKLIATQQVELLCADDFVTFARISIPRSLRSPEAGKETYREFLAANRAIQNWIKAAIDDGRLACEDQKLAARQFIGLINEEAFWPQLVGGQPSPSKAARKRIVDASVSMFLSEYEVKE